MSKRESYHLRPLEESDLEKVLAWRNSERIRTNMYTDHIISIQEHKAWFEVAQLDKNSRYMIFELQGRPIGFVSFTNVDQKNNKCYWAFYIGEEDIPPGTGAFMEFFAIEYAFEVLKIRKLCCEVFVFNSSVIKLHNKFGFTEEGRFVKHILKNNTYEDVISLALFNNAWGNISNRLQKVLFR